MHRAIAASECPRETDVGKATRHAHAAARARWPDVELSLNQFEGHLRRLGWTGGLPKQTDELYLCCGCSLGIREACRRLDDEYFPALDASLALQCRRRDFVEDILQQTRERLLVGPARKIASYRGTGPLASWLRRVSRRLASDLYRQERKNRRFTTASWRYGLESTNDAAAVESGASQSIDARYLGELERALLGAMAQLSAEERRLLHLHYVQGLSVDEIAGCLQRDRSNVYRRLQQIKLRVKRWSMARAREQTGIVDREELDGLFRANCLGIYLDPIVWLDSDAAAGRSAEE